MRKRFFGISSLLMIAALNVNSANPVTPNGVTGFATYNAVDAVKADGSVVKGDVWTRCRHLPSCTMVSTTDEKRGSENHIRTSIVPLTIEQIIQLYLSLNIPPILISS